MSSSKTQDIRNVAIVGHASAGKTTLGEAILASAGAINRMGTVPDGNTVSDFHDDEREHQISMHTSLLQAEWEGKRINLIDTPGYADFISEALGAVRVADVAMIVVHAAHGIGVGTEKVWNQATKAGIPKIFVINAINAENVDFETLLAQIRERFGKEVFPMNVPLNPGPGFNEALDVMRTEKIAYKTDGSGGYEESPAEGELGDRVKQLHQELIEYVAESDDTLLEKFFDEGGLSEDELRTSIHAAVQAQVFVPLFCTAAESNVGVARLLDFVAKFGSSPVDRKSVKALSDGDEEVEVALEGADPVLFIFKTLSEPHVGELSFFRLYSGNLKTGMDVTNTSRRSGEKIGQILQVNGQERTPTDMLSAGDIGALVKLKDTHTNNTLCGGKTSVRLPEVKYPHPNIHFAVSATTKGDEDKIAEGLALIHDEDPTFLYRVDSELHQTVLSGQGDLHLKSVCDTLKRRHRVEIALAQPKVAYRETIRGRAESKYRHKKQTGGAGQFAEVWMRIEPGETDSGVDFKHSLVGQNVDRAFVPSVEKGVREACVEGVLAGYKVVDVKIDFYDGKQHPVDSKDIAFQIAGKQGFREAILGANPRLLEPILEIDVRVPEDAMGNVLGDLSGRRGKVLGMDSEGTMQIVKAQVPQREMHAYASDLRSLTGGRGEHSEQFAHYTEMPRDMEQKVIQESKQGDEEE